MATNRLVSQLKKTEGDIFQQWCRVLSEAGYDPLQSPVHKVFQDLFEEILAALAPADRRTPDPAAPEAVCDEKPFEDEAVRRIFFLKTLTACLEGKIAALGRQKDSDLLRRLRRISDAMELALLSGAGRSVPANPGGTKSVLDPATLEKILVEIFMSVGEGVLIVDEDFEIVKANQHACEIYGMQQQNLIGMDIRLLTDEAGGLLLTKYFEELIEGQRKSAEMTGLYVDGKAFPMTVTVTKSGYNGRRYWPLIVRDDTQRKTMETQLRQEKRQIEEMNLTLKTVMKSIEQDRKDFESRLASRIRTALLPGLKKIEMTTEAAIRKSYLAMLEEQLISLTAGFERKLDASLLKLTRTEIEVCRMIQAGCSTKEICETMKLSFDTVQTHRRNIRRKLSLNGQKMNLHAFLMNRVL